MRRRIVIALLAVVVIGVGAVFVSQPKKGTVEWYKRELTAAHNKMFAISWTAPLERVYWKMTGKRWRQIPKLSHDEIQLLTLQMETSRDSLLTLGYLARRTIAVSNNPSVVMRRAFPPGTIPIRHLPATQFTTSVGGETNKITVTAPTHFLPNLEERIRKADVP